MRTKSQHLTLRPGYTCLAVDYTGFHDWVKKVGTKEICSKCGKERDA